MNRIGQDLRYAFRSLLRGRGVSLAAVVALGLGIGLTTLMFSIVYGILLRQLPLEEAERLVSLSRATADGPAITRVHDYEDWRTQLNSFQELGAYRQSALRVSGDRIAPVTLRGAMMTPSVFRALRVQPVVGRVFSDADAVPGSPRVILLGLDVWQSHFGGDPSIVGRTLRLDGEPTTVIGVMPRRFMYPESEQAWVPLRDVPTTHLRGQGPPLQVMGRLNDGVMIERARAELESLHQRLVQAFPETNRDVAARIGLVLGARMNDSARTTLLATLGAVVLVLLIVCANVASLLIGRANVRAREVGVRTALGASRWRVMSLFLFEALILACAGAVIGTGIGAFGVRWFNAAVMGSAEPPPYWVDIRLDSVALLCVFAAGLFATIAAGVVPALQAARANTNDVLKDEARGSTSFRLGRLSRFIVTGEVALSLALLVGAGLTIKGVFKLYTLDIGIDAGRFFTTHVMLSDSSYRADATRLQFANQLLEQVRGLPGVQAATLATSMPGTSGRWVDAQREAHTGGEPPEALSTTLVTVDEGYFDALGVALLQGREFNTLDRAGALPVALINRSFERRHFNGGPPLGQRIRLLESAGDTIAPWLTIVGVVPDMYAAGIEDATQDAIYRPLAQATPNGLVLLARTAVSPNGLVTGVRQIVSAIDPDLPLENTGSVREIIRRENWFYGVFGTLFAAFGAAALFVATVGLYGVMAFSVSQRRREMGVRKAVGATAGDIVRMVLRQGFGQAAIGVIIGLVLAFAASRLLQAVLFRVQPDDPWIFAGISAILIATALLACWIPARRAARADPLEALRSD